MDCHEGNNIAVELFGRRAWGTAVPKETTGSSAAMPTRCRSSVSWRVQWGLGQVRSSETEATRKDHLYRSWGSEYDICKKYETSIMASESHRQTRTMEGTASSRSVEPG
jgi:hypothetical protein